MDSDNVISEGVLVSGTVSGTGPITIAGRVRGAVDVGGPVVIASSATLEASVQADEVRVSGTIKGPITASRSVTLDGEATVEGDVTAPRVGIDPRARLSGRLEMPLDLPRTARGAGGGARGASRW